MKKNTDYTNILLVLFTITLILFAGYLYHRQTETIVLIGNCEYLKVSKGASHSYSPIGCDCIPDMELLKPN